MIEIEWGGFFLVAGAAVVTSIVLAVFYAGGVRLLSEGQAAHRAGLTTAAWACFAVCAAVVLFGLYLVIPQFHG